MSWITDCVIRLLTIGNQLSHVAARTGDTRRMPQADRLTKNKLLFSALDPAVRAIWAKSGVGGGHGLLAHMLDVAAVAETLLLHEPASTRIWASLGCGLAPEQAARWLPAIAGLHDFGKAIPGFQALWAEGMQADLARGLAFPGNACGATAHACATAALLGKPLHGVTGVDVFWLRHAIQAISAHHGYHFLDDEVHRSRPLGEPSAWTRARQQLLEVYWQLLAPQGMPALEALGLPAVNWLAGLTSIADWIASNPAWFPLGERHDDLHAYHADALQLARKALHGIGWHEARTLLAAPAGTDALMARIVGRDGVRARPLQEAGDRLLRGVSGPALVLVEAPMGEGKTELAFLAHLRLQAANGHRGLYVALPTQATGNALFRRALTFLQGFVEGHADVQLVHGGAAMNEDVVHLRDLDHGRETLSASAWFSQRRRPLLSPYGVGTVDQALYATLNVKHHFVRLWGLSNRVVVLDEVHAYDTYTTGLIAALLQWLKAMGSSVVLMSATLPQARRAELVAAWGLDPGLLPTLPYPRTVLVDGAGVRGVHFAARPLPPIRLAGLGEDLESLADKALELLDCDGCGALIVNTVDRAQKLYSLLRGRLGDGIPVLLFHARFPADERTEREKQVLERFGAQGERPQRALLVATQVAEQSLDLDFDFMLSDLAPADLLLQRAGRLHRHVRMRPAAHEEPRLWIAGLLPAFPDLKATAWGHVYDAYVLGRTWALLGRETTLHLPGDIDRLVQAVYGDGPLPAGLDADVLEFIEGDSYRAHRAKAQKARTESFNIAIDPGSEPHAAYVGKPRGSEEGEDLGLRNTTRLGRPSVTLVPVDVVDGGWCVDGMVFTPDQVPDDVVARRLYGRQLRLSRVAVVRHFRGMPLPVAFAGHPLLRNVYPLPLVQGRCEAGGVRLTWDRQLGLVYDGDNAVSKESA